MDNEVSSYFTEIENIMNNKDKEKLNQITNELNSFLLNNLKDKLQYKEILNNISSLISFIISISNNNLKETNNLYESLLKRNEQTIRILYRDLLTQKLLKDSFENKLRLLIKKDQEYEMIKEKTGASVKNGKVIYNKQKDNEIIILRQENSNLKNTVEDYEKLIKEKELLYNDLNNKYNDIKKKLVKTKNDKKTTIPNININLNDSGNLTKTENAYNYSLALNKNKNKKLLSSPDKKKYKNLYLNFKNFNRKNEIPLYNNLSSRYYQHISLDNIIQKEIYTRKKANSRRNEKSELYINSDSQNDICSLKKRNFKKNNKINFQKKKFNLLKAYTSGSSQCINKFTYSKRLSSFSKKETISNINQYNNHSERINLENNKSNSINKKRYKNSFENEKMYKSYILNIPFNNSQKRTYKEPSKNLSNYKFIYCKTKRDSINKEKNNDGLFINKKLYYKNNNIDTKKIFLPVNIKRKVTNLK